MLYPKIETLWNRDPKTFKVIPGDFRMPEFGLVKQWLYTEKIDGTNIRIILNPTGIVTFGGRTDRAQLYAKLFDYLTVTFTQQKMHDLFDKRDDNDSFPEVTLFGEGYGPKIQRGGKYRNDVAFRLFDVRVGEWWLQWNDIVDVADKLDIRHVPVVCRDDFLPICYAELEDLIPWSSTALLETGNVHIQAEGIVARTDPILCDRRGNRIFWKLKFKDFPSE